MSESVRFKPRARLMSQLGEQLIKDENIAVLELIKNSYDADAKKVKIIMDNVENKKLGRIIIEDNGEGMSLYTVKNYWMEPGTNHKEKKLKDMIKKGVRSKLNRLPMGEKGIGRFGVHKLGNKITLVTRAENSKEVHIEIDWDIFNSGKYLSDIPITLTEKKPTYKFLGKYDTGTKIIIEKIKIEWTRTKVRELYRSILSLNTPFKTLDSFKIDFEIDNKDWLKGLTRFEDIKDYALFKSKMTLKGDKIIDLKYDFTPWKSMKELTPRYERNKEGIDMVKDVTVKLDNGKTRKEPKPIDLEKYKIGPIKIELISFDLDSSVLKLGVEDKAGFKKYLRTNGGIYVCRDKIRIYEYGENDWLGLGFKRVNAPGDKISNNLVLGSVDLERESSSDLQEKTNREGFIEDEAYDLFKEAVLFAVQKFERLRAHDKHLIRESYGVTSKTEPVMHGVAILKDKVDKKINDIKLKKEIFGCLDNIERDYKHITEIYYKSSSAGLSMSVVLHEIDKIISEIEKVVIAEGTSDHLQSLVKRLSQLTDGYAAVVKSSKISKLDLKKIINQSLFMVDFRLFAHDVTVEKKYNDRNIQYKIRGNDNLIISSIINIIDNAIWWLHYAKVECRKIYIDITKDIIGFTSIIIADNGKGFTIPPDMATRPFITDKPGGSMGLGLHLAKELMNQHGGELYFPEFNDLDITEDYRDGAIIALAFKEEIR
ncbi:ATP-binding protein [Vallitalea guaymasensis]|uniref:ATP-binding protein n=1 Tax=Vallitalea guaymasensis TaxID=1185412 RepID=UPI002355D5D3|nr:ATP-binding protein [Vallitalea guaymasensis]